MDNKGILILAILFFATSVVSGTALAYMMMNASVDKEVALLEEKIQANNEDLQEIQDLIRDLDGVDTEALNDKLSSIRIDNEELEDDIDDLYDFIRNKIYPLLPIEPY
jgi:septal ring factor EnvC (AmiA/AmiB activator)